MDNFDLRKYLTEGKLLKENVDFPELEYEFEGTMRSIVVKPEVYFQGILDASAEEIVSDDYYEIMNAVEMGTYSAEEAVKLAKAWAKEKLSNLAKDTMSVGSMKRLRGFDDQFDESINESKMDNFDLKKYLEEGKIYENEYFDVYHEAGDKLENHPNYNKLVSILKDKGFEPDGTPYSDGTGRRNVHGVWDVFKSYTTEPGARGTTLTKANAKDINDALRQAGIEDIEATPSNSYSFRLKVNNLAEGRMHEVFGLFNKKEKLYIPKGINQLHNYVNDRQVKDIEAKIKSKEISPKQLSGINSVMMAVEEFLKAKSGIIENEKNGIKFLIYPTGKAGGLTDNKLDLYINLPQKGKPNNLRTNPEETLKMIKVFIDDYLKKQEGIDVASAKVSKSDDTTAYNITVPISFKELKEK